jgi:hypothetical protein
MEEAVKCRTCHHSISGNTSFHAENALLLMRIHGPCPSYLWLIISNRRAQLILKSVHVIHLYR